jgi:hypothetical protein
MESISSDPIPIRFVNKQLANINYDYANFIVGKVLSPHFNSQQRNKLCYDLRHYFWDDPFVYKKSMDGIIRRCVPKFEQ